MSNPRCFIDLSIDDEPVGRVIFELFADKVPRTADNFRALCTGEKGLSPFEGIPLHYKGSPVHRIIPGFMIQAGDYTQRNGKGGYSIYGGPFDDENLTTELDSAGLLVMANKGPNTNNSQFFITLRPCEHLNGKHVVFGRVIRGMDVVERVSNIETGPKDAPLKPVTIHHCGELERKVKKAPVRSVSPSSVSASSMSASSRSRSPTPDRERKRKSKHRNGSDKRRHRDRRVDERERSPDRRQPVEPRRDDIDEVEARRRREEDERRRAEREREIENWKRRYERRPDHRQPNGSDGGPKSEIKYKGRGVMKAPSGLSGPSRMRGWD